MKHSILLLSLIFIPALVIAQDISDDQIVFVNEFKAAAKDHNKKAIFKGLDKDYRKTQKKFLGSKEQLLNELFSGSGVVDDQFVVIPIDEIIKIEIAEVQENEDGSFTYIFKVRDANHDILAPLLLITNKKRFGFVGASG